MNAKKGLYSIIFLYAHVALSDSQTFHRYFWGNYKQFSGDTQEAHVWYKHLFSSPCSAYSYKGYLLLLLDTQQYQTIVDLIPTISQNFENDPEIQLTLVLALEKCKKMNEADALLIKLSNKFKANADITLRTAQTYLRRKEPENALKAIDNFLNIAPRKANNFIFYFLKSQIHLQLSQLPQALENITLCLDMHPRFDKGWLLFATLQEQRGEIEKSLQGYTTFLELVGDNQLIEQHLFSLLLRHKNEQQYTSFHKTYLDLASSYFNKRKYQASLHYLNKYLTLQPTHHDALMLKLQALAMLNEDRKIIELISPHATNKDFPAQSWPKMLYLLHQNGIKKEKIVYLLQTTGKIYPQNVWFPLYAADLCIQEQKTSEAFSLLKQASSLCTDNALHAKIYHQLGILSYETNNYADMISYLEKGYNLDEKNDYLNNSLAYYWATKGKDIEKAHTFFEKISSHTKANPAIRDTQALILYKQQKYTAAQEILEQLSDKSQNPTILLHLAKLHYKLNNTQKAANLCRETMSYAMTAPEKGKWEKLQLRLGSFHE